MITDQKPLVAIFKKVMMTLSERYKCLYRIGILYKSGLQLYITNWLSSTTTLKAKMKKSQVLT